MSVSKTFTGDPENVRKVLALYRDNPRKPTITEVAALVGTTYHNVHTIIAQNMPADRRKAEKALRYSRSKMSKRNPMHGRSGSLHHGYQGVIAAKDGYLQLKVDGRYELLHRHVMAQQLGMKRLPAWLDVHHIDEIKHNCDPDNLAVVTKAGHGKLHAKRSQSERLPLWAQWESGTSRSTETTLTLPRAS